MNSEKMKWCICQKKGIKLIVAKPHLSRSYIEEADATLENVFSTKGKWKLITAYYACYNALYSILMKCGIKCEIHDCTIELMSLFDFTRDEIRFMTRLKEDRIQAQYYLKNVELRNEADVKNFILRCKVLLNDLNSEEINNVRKNIENMS
ncbi:MAG: hypothetical protein NT129_06625 [Candidatus Aenigmarchaeota archaeon]|nr:hypothetical protein [Candidatus Aenigmarchaeota archaeon]